MTQTLRKEATMRITGRSRHDVVVVGARAAGAATALLLARMGHDVVVVERADLPSDTLSTHQIARTGVVALHRWGLLESVLAAGAPAIRQVTFTSGLESTTRVIKDRAGVDCLVAPRRYVLDTLLAEAAVRAGATVHTGLTMAGVRRDDTGRASGVYGHDRDGATVEIDAQVVVGADGLSSGVARSVGAPLIEQRPARGATHYAYFAGLAWPAIEFYTEPGTFAGVFPTNDGEACIWVCAPTETARQARRTAGSAEAMFTAELRRAAPALASRLATARRTSPVKGMFRMPNQLRRAYGAGWALVGDASYHRDAVSGHGLSDAFRDAEYLATALDLCLGGQATEAEALADYQCRRDRALREVFEITCAQVEYPPVPEFVELTRRLGMAIDTEAADLAARPVPGEPQLVPA
jgi:2-polyprenyl-6-methoxyphenol hydroxylase-like FAD-dependent oxidoreductase